MAGAAVLIGPFRAAGLGVLTATADLFAWLEFDIACGRSRRRCQDDGLAVFSICIRRSNRRSSHVSADVISR